MRITLLLSLACGAAVAQTAPETIYFNASILTMDAAHPSAQAVSLGGGRFTLVGDNATVLRRAGPLTRTIDLGGRCVVPGLIESHVHPIAAALGEIDGPVPPLNSTADIRNYVQDLDRKLPPGRMIFVPKVYCTRLLDLRYPTRQELDGVTPGREVLVDNGYASVLNSALLRRLGITRDTPQPANGHISMDERGEPTGLILGAPQILGRLRTARTFTANDRVGALKSMLKRYNTVGIASIGDGLEGPAGFRAYQSLKADGGLSVRCPVTYLVQAQGTPAQVREEIERIPFVTGWGDEWLRVGELKTAVDGGILMGTAYLREPWGARTRIFGFVDPGYRGLLSVPRENLLGMARTAAELGWQMTAHATGGGAIDLLLDAYEAADREAPIAGRSFTVLHGNIPNPEAIARSRKLGVVFDVQPCWLYLDGPVIQDILGPERMKHFLPLRDLFDAGIVVGGGSDHMLRFDPRQATNPYHPFLGKWIAVTRKTSDGRVLGPEQRISRMEALKMWTWNGAYLMFAEKEKGSIEAGKLADMAVLSKNYLTCPPESPEHVPGAIVVAAFKGGNPAVAKSRDRIEGFTRTVTTRYRVRLVPSIADLKRDASLGPIQGVLTFGPMDIETYMPDLFWYGIHCVEALYQLMGPGCERVARVHTKAADSVVGTWKDGRIGEIRGLRSSPGTSGAIVFGATLVEESLEVLAFMEAADRSKEQHGAPAPLEPIL